MNLREERLVRFSDVPRLKWLPKRHGGRPIHISTVYRWEQRGLRGVRLESMQLGGTRCTSEEALIRFFARISGRSHPQPSSVAPTTAFTEAERVLNQAHI
jgi:hypothetical protein